jgi:NAD(P)-dependent dehydrogenase (short-subunit alcohol dehydrogenase family)
MHRREQLRLSDRRVLITGAARGIGAETARRLHARGAKVALVGLEPAELERVAHECGEAPWQECDVSDRAQVDAAVEASVAALGGLDVVVANAGVAALFTFVGGDPTVFERTLAVNALGVFYTLRAAAPHISHPGGYALTIASLAAAVHLPLFAPYSASKAAAEAISNTLRAELYPTGARVGVAYFSGMDTDMSRRGFGTGAGARVLGAGGPFLRIAPVTAAVNAIERGIEQRSRRVVSPGWVAAVLPVRMLAQRFTEVSSRRGLQDLLDLARSENAPLTTIQPESSPEL